MSTISEQDYLVSSQYRDSSNLDALIALHLRFCSNQTGWFRWCYGQLRIPPVARVLDIGCGPAALWCDQPSRLCGCCRSAASSSPLSVRARSASD